MHPETFSYVKLALGISELKGLVRGREISVVLEDGLRKIEISDSDTENPWTSKAETQSLCFEHKGH